MAPRCVVCGCEMPDHVIWAGGYYEMFCGLCFNDHRRSEMSEPTMFEDPHESSMNRLLDDLHRLRAENEFLKSRYQMHSPQMNGDHGWLAHNPWPEFHGNTIDEAVQRAMREVGADKQLSRRGYWRHNQSRQEE